VRIWAADGAPRATLTGHTRWVRAVAIAPDGTWLASGSDDKTVRIWAADGAPRATLIGHTGQVFAVAIAPDGTWLASGDRDGTVRIWGSAAPPEKVHNVTAIRVNDAVLACAWLEALRFASPVTRAFTGSRCNRRMSDPQRTHGACSADHETALPAVSAMAG
jgi:WD40 repeat protein